MGDRSSSRYLHTIIDILHVLASTGYLLQGYLPPFLFANFETSLAKRVLAHCQALSAQYNRTNNNTLLSCYLLCVI